MPFSFGAKSASAGAKSASAAAGASNLQFHEEEFVSKLLNRRWMLEKPDTKIHQIMLSKKQSQFVNGYLGGIHFSINTNPGLGIRFIEPSCKDPSFYIVRDDLLHPLVNGNKARKLDGLLPIVEEYSGTDVVTCGGCQSAHAAAVAVSCAEKGITSHLLLRGEEPEILTGYNLVSKMYGNVVYVPRSLYAKREEMLTRHANEVAGANGSVSWFRDVLNSLAMSTSGAEYRHAEPDKVSEIHQRKVVVVNEGAGDVVALLGVIRLVDYLSQSNILGDRPCTFVVDAGTGTTAVGLRLGALCLGLPWKVTAVMLADTLEGYKMQEDSLISDFKCFCDSIYAEPLLNDSNNEPICWTHRINPRKFGKVLDGEVNACQQVANQTGILVDPIYTLAAWELAMLLSQQESEEGRNVVMLHTGGTLGMFGLAQRYKSHFRLLKDDI